MSNLKEKYVYFRDIMEERVFGIKDILDGWRFRREARRALAPVKNDALYVAEIIKKYGLEKKNYHFAKNLRELAASASPLEEEVEKYSKASSAVHRILINPDLSFGAYFKILNGLYDLYFDENSDSLKLR